MLRNILSIIKKYWPLAVAAGVIVLWLYAGRREKNPHKQEQQELQGVIDVLKSQSDALRQSMTQTDRLIDLHENTTAEFMRIISANNAAIQTIKKQTNEQVDRVRSYDADDIKRFYSELERQHHLHTK
jgi:Na+/phosphate symporter